MIIATDQLSKYKNTNENHLHLRFVSGNMQIIHPTLKVNIPQQPAHMGVRSRMVAVFMFLPWFHSFIPITQFLSICVMGFFCLQNECKSHDTRLG